MSSTMECSESFPKGTSREQMERERNLKIEAGAISSTYTGSESDGWTLTTVWWKVIGKQ